MQNEENINDGSWASNGIHILETLKRLEGSSDKQETQLNKIHTIVTQLTTQTTTRQRFQGFIGGLVPFIGLAVWWVLKQITNAK